MIHFMIGFLLGGVVMFWLSIQLAKQEDLLADDYRARLYVLGGGHAGRGQASSGADRVPGAGTGRHVAGSEVLDRRVLCDHAIILAVEGESGSITDRDFRLVAPEMIRRLAKELYSPAGMYVMCNGCRTRLSLDSAQMVGCRCESYARHRRRCQKVYIYGPYRATPADRGEAPREGGGE